MTIPTMREGSVVHLAVANNPPSLRDALKLDFEADPTYVNFQSNTKLLQSHEEKLRNVAISSRLAMVILSKSKTELVEWIKSMDEDGMKACNELIENMVTNTAMAKALAEFMATARTRLGVAMTSTVPEHALDD
jgi:hypothetical protein